jgi:snRNA-activating protein complex subunit 3
MGRGALREMSEMRVDDLVLRLGEPYVYIHRADCEHVLVFARAR